MWFIREAKPLHYSPRDHARTHNYGLALYNDGRIEWNGRHALLLWPSSVPLAKIQLNHRFGTVTVT